MKNWLSYILHATSAELFRTVFGLTGIYYEQKPLLLRGVLAGAGLALIVLFGRSPDRRKLFRDKRASLFFSLLQQSGIIFFGGGVLYLLQVLPAAKCAQLPLLLGLYGSLVILLITLWQLIFYPSRRYELLVERLQNGSILLLLDMLFLNALGQLDSLEFLTGMLLAALCKSLGFLLDARHQKKDACCQAASGPAFRDDLPVEDASELFGARKRQLAALVKECEDWPDEPYAALLSAPWGFGKTSFIRAFQKQILANGTGEFITVNAGYNPSLSGFLQDISAQLCSIFKKNRFWIHGNDALKGYFRHIESLMRSARYTTAADYLSHVFSDRNLDLETHKEECNAQIAQFCEQCRKRIYIIIDDIDRSQAAERELFFDVMRQCLSLRYCRVFFLADYETLQTERLTKAYMEKYINRRIVLDGVGFSEIAAQYLPGFFSEDELTRLNKPLQEQVRALKADLPRWEAEVEQTLEYALQSALRTQTKLADQGRLTALQEGLWGLKHAVQNPRRVKRFLFEFLEKRIYLAQNCWFFQPNAAASDFTGLDWAKTLASLALIECFFPEEYTKLEQCTSVYSYRFRFPEEVILPLLLPALDKRNVEDTKLAFLDLLIFGLYHADPQTDMSTQLRCLHEMKESFNDAHIGQYLSCCTRVQTDFAYPCAMLDWLESPSSEASTERTHAILQLANTYVSQYYPDGQARFGEYVSVLRRLRRLMEGLLQAGSKEAQKTYQICCANLEEHLITQIHFDFDMLLPVLFHEPAPEKTPEDFHELKALRNWLCGKKFLWETEGFGESMEDIEVTAEAARRVNKQMEVFYADTIRSGLLPPAVPELYKKRLDRAVEWLSAWEETPKLPSGLKTPAVLDRRELLSSALPLETILENLNTYTEILRNTGAEPELWEGQAFASLLLWICGQYQSKTFALATPKTGEIIERLREIGSRITASADCEKLLQTPEWCNGQMYLYRLSEAAKKAPQR